MGYRISVHRAKFAMKASEVPKALVALKKLVVRTQLDWVDVAAVEAAGDFNEALEACRWSVEFDARENVNHIDFGGENAGDDLKIFRAIAPYVGKGSYIEMAGEDGERWRWYFDGKTCKQQQAIVTYK